ncbi:MFS transporter [Paenibacillus sp. GCM10027627]|uniref:MFS transporter n=1 Tax=unclassified Paenibacillus TaxID=185978 RepID=UPI0036306BF6
MGVYLKDVLDISPGARRFLLSEALYGIGIGLYTLVLNYHLLAMGIGEAKIGAIASTGILVLGALAIPLSMLANRIGRKPILVSGVLLIGSGVYLFSAGDELIHFYCAQIMVSIGFACIETTEVPLLFSYSRSRREETQVFSLMFAVFTMFVGGGTLLAGLIPEWISSGGEGSPYKPVLWCASAVFIGLGLIRALWLPKETRGAARNGRNKLAPSEEGVQAAEAVASPHTGKPAKAVRGRPSKAVWTLAFYMLLSGISFALIGGFNNVIAKQRLGWDDSSISLLLTVNGLVLFFASLLTPWVLEKFGIAKPFKWMYFGGALLAFILSLQLPVAAFAVLLLVRGGGFTMLSNMIDSQSMSALPEKDRNLFAGMRSVFRSVGSAGATYTTGFLLAGGHAALPFALTGVMLLIGYVYYYRFVRPLLQDKETGGHTT